MTTIEADIAAAQAVPLEYNSEPAHMFRHALGATAKALGCVGAGALIGLGIAEHTPTHVEVAGSDASVWLEHGHAYDQLSLDDAITGKISTSRQLAGESIGVKMKLNFDSSTLVDQDGNFNTDVLPAYIQLYSDPAQIKSDIESGLEEHYLLFVGAGAALGALAFGGKYWYKGWRKGYDTEHQIDPSTALAYHAPEKKAAKRLAVALAVTSAIGLVPASHHQDTPPTAIVGDPALVGTPLEGMHISGPLAPVVSAVESYIEKYFKQNDTYYNQLKSNLMGYLAANPVQIPSGDNIINVGFVTDRHCNIGMDRVIVPLLQHYGVKTLLSGGDDDLNGSFSFESGCTSDLAERSKKAGIKDDFIDGNHDSAMTAANETKQGITLLNDKVISVNGVNLIGEADPRDSRWGVSIHVNAAVQKRDGLESLSPYSNEAQLRATTDQGERIGAIACKSDKKMIAILHDPHAGQAAVKNGCGNITLALDGHTHKQAGPTSIELPDGRFGYQFTGGSSGGAPGPNQHQGNPLGDLTVGPLNHDALVYIVSINKQTGEPISITDFDFAPSQTISVNQQIMDPAYFAQPETTSPPLAAQPK